MGYPILKEKSERILNLQKALNAFGLGIKEDGIYGNQTKNALNTIYMNNQTPTSLAREFRDKYTEERIALLHPQVREDFANFILDAESQFDITLRISQGLRTFPEQDAIYAQGRTKPGTIVTKAKGGQSYHNYGLAIDLVRIKDKDVDWNYNMETLVPLANKYNLKWGGTFKDYPHFERSNIHWKILLEKYNKKDFIKDTKYINL